MRPLLLTAGATRNPVDTIRYLSASASGRTALDLARRLRGHVPIHVLGSTEACLRGQLLGVDDGLVLEEYGSTRDLMARMERWLNTHPRGMLVHSAAVGDYEAQAVDTKIPSGQAELVLRLTPTPKIIDRVREWAPDAVVVSFKAGRPGLRPEALAEIASRQLVRTRSDRVFANVLGALGESCLWVTHEGYTAFAERSFALDALEAYLREMAPR